MKNPVTFHPVYLLAVIIGLVQTGNSSIVAQPEPYYISDGVAIGGAFLFFGCREWNAVHVIEKRYRVKVTPEFAGCIPTEETNRMITEMHQQNERVDRALRQAGILSEKGTVWQALREEFQRQYQLDDLLRRQAFFQQQEETEDRPIFIQSEALPDINQFEVSLFQENRAGQMFRIMRASVDLSTSEVRWLKTEPVPAEYPLNCFAGT